MYPYPGRIVRIPVPQPNVDYGTGTSQTSFQEFVYDYESLRYVPVRSIKDSHDKRKKEEEEKRQKREKLLNIISYFYHSR